MKDLGDVRRRLARHYVTHFVSQNAGQFVFVSNKFHEFTGNEDPAAGNRESVSLSKLDQGELEAVSAPGKIWLEAGGNPIQWIGEAGLAVNGKSPLHLFESPPRRESLPAPGKT